MAHPNSGIRFQRHPATVTALYLGDAVARWSNLLSPTERAAVDVVINALHEIATGVRKTRRS